MKKMILIIAAVLVVLIVAVGAAMWYWIQKPLYEPGLVRAGQALNPCMAPAHGRPDAGTREARGGDPHGL